jgi:hypothetical protein
MRYRPSPPPLLIEMGRVLSKKTTHFALFAIAGSAISHYTFINLLGECLQQA